MKIKTQNENCFESDFMNVPHTGAQAVAATYNHFFFFFFLLLFFCSRIYCDPILVIYAKGKHTNTLTDTIIVHKMCTYKHK